MNGIIFLELKKYVMSNLGDEAWIALAEEAGIPQHKAYLAGASYPDQELVCLVEAASKITSMPPDQLLGSFGEFIVPDLVEVFAPFIDPSWKTLDLLEHTEDAIHRAVRLQDKNAAPPALAVTRSTPETVTIRYDSARQLCALVKGIAKGVARLYGESVEIEESACMHRGAPACTITVTLASTASEH